MNSSHDISLFSPHFKSINTPIATIKEKINPSKTACITHILFIKIICSLASSFFTVSCTSRTSTFTSLLPKEMEMISPSLTLADAFAGLSLISTLPLSQASLATVRRLISRDTFKYLSNLMLLTSRSSVSEKQKRPERLSYRVSENSASIMRSAYPLMPYQP